METSNCNFRKEEFNEKMLRDSYKKTRKSFNLAYYNSIPLGLNLISIYESRKPPIKGIANGFVFYIKPYDYLSAGFNLNDYNSVDYNIFILRIETMFSTLYHLNKKPIRALDVFLILKHIRDNGNFVFNLNAMYFKVRKFQNSPFLVVTKTRDYNVIENQYFRKKIDFLKAMNKARKIVNHNNNLNDLFALLNERITNEDYSYLTEAIIVGRKCNHLIIYAIVQKINLLCTGLQRQGRKLVKSDSLYTISMKRLTLKTKLLDTQQKIVFMQKAILKCERKLIVLKQLVANRLLVHQMFLILKELTGLETELKITKDIKVQDQLKLELMNIINKTNGIDVLSGAKEFDRIYKKKSINEYFPQMPDPSREFTMDFETSPANILSQEEMHFTGNLVLRKFYKIPIGELSGTMNFGILTPD